MDRFKVRTRFYSLVRDLHLYVGLFLSPFVMLFAASVVLLNHPAIPLGKPGDWRAKDIPVEIPPGLDNLRGMERIEQARRIVRQAGISGEIGFILYSAEDRRLIIPVSRPGYEATVTVTLSTGQASMRERGTGFWDALIYLHKMPGPHLADVRRNWIMVRLWGYMADGTAWLVLFLSITGIYLWAILRSERLVGGVLIAAGAVSLLGALYALCS